MRGPEFAWAVGMSKFFDKKLIQNLNSSSILPSSAPKQRKSPKAFSAARAIVMGLPLELRGLVSRAPPGCPNPQCATHLVGKDRQVFSYRRRGSAKRKDGTVRVRYRCCVCGQGFSSATFDINYRLKNRGHQNARIFWGVVHNRSNRSMSRELEVSENCVRGRVRRLSQVALVEHYNYMKGIQGFDEEYVYDGLEAFARSQYEPCNINQVVGADSLYTYIFNYAPMNRKGRMSDRQREYLKAKEEQEGRFDPQAIRKTTHRILQELLKLQSEKGLKTEVVFRSDEHFQYRRAIERDLGDQERSQIQHRTVSSKECRNYKNILFAVNHLDLLIRRKVAAFTRETICFAKKASSLVEKYILFVCYKNYMKPCFTKLQKRDPSSNTQSPAMRLKITDHLLSFGEFFSYRNPNPRIDDLPLDWAKTLRGESAFERSFKFVRGQETAVA
jgi:hypothetical protein